MNGAGTSGTAWCAVHNVLIGGLQNTSTLVYLQSQSKVNIRLVPLSNSPNQAPSYFSSCYPTAKSSS
jgi:hypothetical protein